MVKKKYTRRDWIKIVGILSLSYAFPKFSIIPANAKEVKKLHKISRTLPLMGTYVNITIYDSSKQRAYSAQEGAFSKIRQLMKIFNRFDRDSYISYLNKEKKLTDVPYELKEVLSLCNHVARLTKKEFDITILPLLEEIENEIKVHGHFPSPKKIKEILPYVGWNNIFVSSKKIHLASGTKITLDGIAKGYIVDQAVEVLKKYEVSHAIVDAGGDIRALGGKSNTHAWKVGIEDPKGRLQYLQIVKLKDMAIATSGNYRNFYDKSKKIFHIIDKKGTLSPQRITSCSVISSSAALADGLATGLYLVPPEKAISLANQKNIPTLIATRGNKIFTSSSWHNFT